MMRRREGGKVIDRPGDGALSVIEVSHGCFAAASRLNPDFDPGVPKLKLTVRIAVPAGRPRPFEMVEALSGFLPTLSFHRCCGIGSIRETFLERSKRRDGSGEEEDDGVDHAHLLEHVLIDLQHHVARMRRCSGATCAYVSPPDRYDIFVECPEERVGRTCAAIAAAILVDLMQGRSVDPTLWCQVLVARLARDREGLPISAALGPLRADWGRRTVETAIESLVSRGYLDEVKASLNFSGDPLLAYRSTTRDSAW